MVGWIWRWLGCVWCVVVVGSSSSPVGVRVVETFGVMRCHHWFGNIGT